MADLYKPISESTGTPAYLTDSPIVPILQLADGRLVRGRDTGASNGRKHTWRFDVDPRSIGTFRIVDSSTNRPLSGELEGGQRYEGGDFGSLQPVSGQGNLGGGGASDGNLQSTPQGVGALPANLSGQFPTYQPVDFQPIPPADFNLTDPQEYASQYGEFNRGEFVKNFGLGQRLGLEQLQTELQGLRSFVPAAAALKRSETSIDNVYNQAQRSRQIYGVIPDVLANLKGQTTRAGILATGRLPSEIEDRALEIGLRSEGADIASTRGFGDDSLIGKKVSDIMSAKERLGISQIGDQLITQNAATRSALELAPTEYSDAGQQIRVLPEVGAGRAGTAIGSELTGFSGIRAEAALGSKVQQEEFKTSTDIDVNKFNANGLFQESQINSENQFTAQAGYFNYLDNRAHEISNLDQATINQSREDEIRKQLTQEFQSQFKQTQDSNTVKDVVGLLVTGASLFAGGGGAGGGGAAAGGAGGGGVSSFLSLLGGAGNFSESIGGLFGRSATPQPNQDFTRSASFQDGDTERGYLEQLRRFGIDYSQFQTDLGV